MLKRASTKNLLPFIDPENPQPCASFIEQLDRVAPHLGKLGYWIETLKHPKCVLNEVMAFSDWMAIKIAVLNLLFGGAKSSLRDHPEKFPFAELVRPA